MRWPVSLAFFQSSLALGCILFLTLLNKPGQGIIFCASEALSVTWALYINKVGCYLTTGTTKRKGSSRNMAGDRTVGRMRGTAFLQKWRLTEGVDKSSIAPNIHWSEKWLGTSLFVPHKSYFCWILELIAEFGTLMMMVIKNIFK